MADRKYGDRFDAITIDAAYIERKLVEILGAEKVCVGGGGPTWLASHNCPAAALLFHHQHHPASLHRLQELLPLQLQPAPPRSATQTRYASVFDRPECAPTTDR